MDKQYIVVISREFGSGGHEIAEMLSKKLNVNLYDRKMLDEIAMEKNMHVDQLKKHEEKPRRKLLSRSVRGYSNSPEEIIAEMQFDYIRKKADSGESFVIVGRCADTVLRDRPGMISIFVTGDKECKIKRIMNVFGISREEAESKRKRHDRTRKQYHNIHSDFKWGDSRYYDVCINSSKLGEDITADLLETYIKERINKM